jgi:acetyltransferase-like isoleucine patch superfamily enzyme
MIPKNVVVGRNSWVAENVSLGVSSRKFFRQKEEDLPATKIGNEAVIRSGTTIYCDVTIGDKFQTGHNVLIREKTLVGDYVLVGSNSIIEGETKIGNSVRIQSMVYIPLYTTIEDWVFIGPCASLTNDKYPVRTDDKLEGPVLKMGCSIGSNSTILPAVEIGEGSIVAAGSIVTKDVPPWKLAIGTPAKIRELPEGLKVRNFPEH